MVNMKLSEQLKQDSDSGDFGRALDGYAERAEKIESELEMAKFWMKKVCDYCPPRIQDLSRMQQCLNNLNSNSPVLSHREVES